MLKLPRTNYHYHVNNCIQYDYIMLSFIDAFLVVNGINVLALVFITKSLHSKQLSCSPHSHCWLAFAGTLNLLTHFTHHLSQL